MRPRRVTALDVAVLAGVSRSAVSRTFTRGASVAPATRTKVLRAAEQLGYNRNALALGMFNRRSGMMGAVTGGLDNPFIATGLEHLSMRLQREGIRMLTYSGDAEQDLEVALPALVEYRIDGCFILSNHLSPEAASNYERLGIPLVVVFSSGVPGIPDPGGNAPVGTVSVDNFAAGQKVGELLIGAGRRRLAHIAGLVGATSSRQRLDGFRGAVEARGNRLVASVTGDFSYEGGRRAARELFSGNEAIDAVFCGNDLMALAAIDVARNEFGLSVPGDVAVVGFDDIEVGRYPSYGLTTMRQPAGQMIDAAVDLMLRLVDGSSDTAMEVKMEAKLVRRTSAP